MSIHTSKTRASGTQWAGAKTMTNHPNRDTMHHFSVVADRTSGAWDHSSIEYIGTVRKADFYALTDTDDVHYDQHDGETFSPAAMADAGIETTANIALTVTWSN
jgi:hypothetical protein